MVADIGCPLKTHAIVFFNETHLIYGGEDKNIYVYSFESKETRQVASEHQLRYHAVWLHCAVMDRTHLSISRIRELHVMEMGGVHFLISGSSDGGVKIWSIRVGDGNKELTLSNIANHSIDARITCMAISLA